MPADMSPLLQNVQAVLLNQQYQHAHFLKLAQEMDVYLKREKEL